MQILIFILVIRSRQVQANLQNLISNVISWCILDVVTLTSESKLVRCWTRPDSDSVKNKKFSWNDPFLGNVTTECAEQPVHQSSWTIIVSRLPRKWFNVMVKILKRFQFFQVNSLTGPLSLSQKSDNLYRKCKKWWEFRTKIHQKWLKNYLKMHNS